MRAMPKQKLGSCETADTWSIATLGAPVPHGKTWLEPLKRKVNMGLLVAPEEQPAAAHSFEPLIDSVAAAALLRIHRKTLERMALRGEVPGHKIGRFWRFRASELDAWLCSRLKSGRQPCCTTTF